jgi:YfiH family protein
MIVLERVGFTGAAEGDVRHDDDARRRVSERLGIAADWATVRQVHGATVHRVTVPGWAGEGDAVWTEEPGLPVAVFTADCLGVAVVADGAVGVAHAGWRGAAAGVVPALVAAMRAAGHEPGKAFVGPGIGPCCFEVGPEVAELFPGHVRETTWGSVSVDLPGVVAAQLEGIDVETIPGCTFHEEDWFSHRRAGATERQVAVAWL